MIHISFVINCKSHRIMDTKKTDFSYLIIRAFMNFGESYTEIRQRYKGFPVCLMEYIDKDEHSEHIRINFDKEGACVTFSFDRHRMP